MTRPSGRELVGGGREVRGFQVATGGDGVKLQVVLAKYRPAGGFNALGPPDSFVVAVII
jgi:hypothetical protein